MLISKRLLTFVELRTSQLPPCTSYVCNDVAQQGVPIESVSKMLGHTNIKTTQIYARITNKKIEQDMMQVADKFDGFKNCFIN